MGVGSIVELEADIVKITLDLLMSQLQAKLTI